LGLYNTWQSANAYLFFTGLVRMKKLLLATICVIALTVGAQAKPVQLGLIDKWVIEYDSELFAGACIATVKYDLLKLKISFITAYPKGRGRDRKTLVPRSF
jgi:hypothetical protein